MLPERGRGGKGPVQESRNFRTVSSSSSLTARTGTPERLLHAISSGKEREEIDIEAVSQDRCRQTNLGYVLLSNPVMSCERERCIGGRAKERQVHDPPNAGRGCSRAKSKPPTLPE